MLAKDQGRALQLDRADQPALTKIVSTDPGLKTVEGRLRRAAFSRHRRINPVIGWLGRARSVEADPAGAKSSPTASPDGVENHRQIGLGPVLGGLANGFCVRRSLLG